METIGKDAGTNGEAVIPNLDGVNVIPNEDFSREFPNEEVNIFVLGHAVQKCRQIEAACGPGSGKGTQCSQIVEHFGFCHLSTGDLLDTEIMTGSKNGIMIKNLKTKGELVPTEIVVKHLQKAMKERKIKKFLIDGFPRDMENLAAAENIMKLEPDFVLFLECSHELMIKRVLGRKQGRVDDNIETIQRRIKVHCESSLPVVSYYSSKGKVEKINGEKPIKEVFEAVKNVFSKFITRKYRRCLRLSRMSSQFVTSMP